MALVTASGPLGLSAFMPDHTVFVNKATTTPTHHTPLLPMTDTWQAADFSLESVIRDTEMPGAKVDLRRYTSRLLSRYLYTSGELFIKTVVDTRAIQDPVSHDRQSRARCESICGNR